ncbi:type I DNA topoisomerase [Thalassobaculum sp. OXR-137]|uniref:type I DNA topoisomerase n=1 Tax=Thalassobaculum sp. OXR-137 TaxID=3100173 RepID=UPI002AC8AA4B|nr:type I DNA topoisomerase [Thalassobaculum sp. OXR-137]WPZ33587.1 type I DNA topoisomerase [Thalassobaculum sp. OXR-137]
MTKVVVVESPAKAKTINKYLGSDYHVLASYGHIRDLPPKDGSVDPDQDFQMLWQTDQRSEKQVKAIADAVKGAEQLILATDPDREGEAISWHIRNVLAERKVLKDIDVKRVAFNAITKDAVLDAMAHPRELDQDLVDAYLARRALDYLVGFTLSPVLWRKLPGARSAGRVQSVALRLICERESEIERFVAQEYWSVEAVFRTQERKTFTARLTHLDGQKLDRLDIKSEAQAKAAVAAIEAGDFSIGSVEKKRVKRNPAPPFTTSTLQQEASRKLGFGATRTMQLAQRLYEGVDIGGETTGLITYMRTDGVQMSPEAITQIRRSIGGEYGDRYLPNTPRVYSTKAKNAQEAHEAIRPTDVNRSPEALRSRLDADQWKLYSLIWKRAVASQMASAELDQTTIDVTDKGGRSVLRATGSVIAFDGFLKLYREDRDDSDGAELSDDENDKILPAVADGDAVSRQEVTPEQHFTQPPPRYSEASLVKRMEELGIGRPSTYASILQVLQDREYVRLDRRRFIPEDRGRLVTTFLSSFFERYVQYNFTADLETQLDNVSDGQIDWRQVLRDFWSAFKGSVDGTKDLSIGDVIEKLDAELADHFFPKGEDGQPARECPGCGAGKLSLRLGKFGAFIGCSNYPECKFTRQLGEAAGGRPVDGESEGGALPRVLGQDPVTGKDVSLKKGPYGVYVQLGEPEEGSKEKPKRASLPKQVSPADIDLQKGLALLSLPRPVGEHPETKDMIEAGIGRFGPYLKYAGSYVSLPGDDTVLTIGLNHAVQILAEKGSKKKPGRPLGDHPVDGKPVTVQAGRYGPYAQHGSLRATLPKGEEMDDITLERAIELLNAKAEKSGKGAPKKASGKKTPAKKSTAKKADAKADDAKADGGKPAAKKAAPKKKASAKKAPAKKTAAKSKKAGDGDTAGTTGS